MNNICPIMSICGEKRSCMEAECKLWGVVGYKTLYQAWQNVASKIANGEPIDEPIYGCTLRLHLPTQPYNLCCITDVTN